MSFTQMKHMTADLKQLPSHLRIGRELFHTDIIHRQGEGGKYIQLGIQLYVQVKYLLMKLTLLAARSTQLTEPPAAINTA